MVNVPTKSIMHILANPVHMIRILGPPLILVSNYSKDCINLMKVVSLLIFLSSYQFIPFTSIFIFLDSYQFIRIHFTHSYR